jgi:hypothetical protein
MKALNFPFGITPCNPKRGAVEFSDFFGLFKLWPKYFMLFVVETFIDEREVWDEKVF